MDAHAAQAAGVLIVSAHWEAAPLMLSAPGAATPLVYDFGGFQPRYYTLTYPTPDASSLAREVAGLMPAASGVHQHPSRGLDHGAWVPLKVMYPLADVPVLQLSIPTSDPSFAAVAWRSAAAAALVRGADHRVGVPHPRAAVRHGGHDLRIVRARLVV